MSVIFIKIEGSKPWSPSSWTDFVEIQYLEVHALHFLMVETISQVAIARVKNRSPLLTGNSVRLTLIRDAHLYSGFRALIFHLWGQRAVWFISNGNLYNCNWKADFDWLGSMILEKPFLQQYDNFPIYISFVFSLSWQVTDDWLLLIIHGFRETQLLSRVVLLLINAIQ